MSTFDDPALLDALSAPLGDLITAVGTSVADAQRALDKSSLESLKELYQSEHHAMLQAIGYRPTWYQIPEVDAEITMALTVTGSTEETANTKSRVALYGAPVDAGYTRRFGFELQAASRVKFKVVPVPPSTQAELLQAVPPLTGRTLRQAIALLRTLNLDYERPDPADLDAKIIQQSPPPGSILEPEERVVLELELAPDILGLTLREARSQLAAEGLTLDAPGDAHDHSLIVSQTPNPGGAISTATVIVEVLRSPDLVGLSGADARNAIVSLGLTVGQVVADEERVTEQYPEPGLLLDAGVTVDVRSKIPDLSGKTIKEAREILSRFGSLAAVVPGTPEKALVGVQSPPAGNALKLGDIVQLDSARMPDLTGKTLSEANTLVSSLGLQLGRHKLGSSDPLVAHQDPAAGTPLATGVVVSVEPMTLEDLSGVSCEEAVSRLQGLGIDVDLPRGAHPQVRVTAIDPAPGTLVTRALTVEIELARVPELIGLSVLGVTAKLNELGMPMRMRPQPARGKVVRQDPEPGKALSRSKRYVTVDFE